MVLDLLNFGLGMKRKEVTLVPHNSKWAEAFIFVREKILGSLRNLDLELHHIGSTAIPEIPAKPVLDVLGVVRSLAEFDSFVPTLEKMGFECKGEYGIRGRRYAVLYDNDKALGLVHLHVFETPHPEIDSHIWFRDYLIKNPDAAREYGQLKTDLQAKFRDHRETYTAAKANFIQSIVGAMPARPSN